ncbi:MAG: carbohydrate kinase, partial [Chloroflexi bacterium]|nr:carbohydrate kinase [Chloroflexota bacterium]
DDHQLTLLPLIAGERSPNWRADVRGALTGLSQNTGAEHILRAAMDGVALQLALVWELLKSAVPNVRHIIASGGAASASPLWMQTVADALNETVVVLAEREATSHGAALLVLEAVGALRIEDATFAMRAQHEPRAAQHAIYLHALERQQQLYARLFG